MSHITRPNAGKRIKHFLNFSLISLYQIVWTTIQATPFENPQRWMGQNTFPILLLNDDNMIGEH